jgi:putative serine protease PepD
MTDPRDLPSGPREPGDSDPAWGTPWWSRPGGDDVWAPRPTVEPAESTREAQPAVNGWLTADGARSPYAPEAGPTVEVSTHDPFARRPLLPPDPLPAGASPAEAPMTISSLPWGPRPGDAAQRDERASRRPRAWLLVALATAIAVIASGLGAVGALWVESMQGEEVVDGTASLGATAAGTTRRAPGSVPGVAAQLLPSVVSFEVRTPGGRATGSGFVIHPNGYILTNNHVVRPATGDSGSITVTFNDGTRARARIVGRDDSYDLAVVKVPARDLPVVTFGDSDAVVAGDSVLAIGSPLGLSGTVTLGIVSALERPVTAGVAAGEASFISAIQTDAAINPGNSGGPLVNLQGEVVGVNSAIATLGADSGLGATETGSIGLGFAVPMNQARRTAQQLIRQGYATHPVIGVSLDAAYAGRGARVLRRSSTAGSPVRPGGPADLAGIQPGDVIRTIDGERVQSSEELIVAIRARQPGDVIELTYVRRGKEREARLTLGESDPPEDR